MTVARLTQRRSEACQGPGGHSEGVAVDTGGSVAMKSVRTGSIRMTIQMKTTIRITVAMAIANAVSQSGISLDGSGSDIYPVSVMTSIFVGGTVAECASPGDESFTKSSTAFSIWLPVGQTDSVLVPVPLLHHRTGIVNDIETQGLGLLDQLA